MECGSSNILLVIHHTKSDTTSDKQDNECSHDSHCSLVWFECLLTEERQAAAEGDTTRFGLVASRNDEAEFWTIDRELNLITVLEIPFICYWMTIEESLVGFGELN